MSIVWTIKEKCQRCYTCIRECPAKAIKVEKGQAEVIPERCLGCGHCYTVCTQGAKAIQSGVPKTTQWLRSSGESGSPVAALLAPSFPAAYPGLSYRRLVGALRAAGFSHVYEVATGAELVNQAYNDIYQSSKEETKTPFIASSCPAIVEYVEKYQPDLISNLIKVVSPMAATGKLVKEMVPDIKTVFIGPCIAKKKERLRPEVEPFVDEVITFEELNRILNDSGVDFSSSPASDFDPPRASLARLYPISGGLTHSAGLNYDLMDNSIILTEGKLRALDLLDLVSKNQINTRFIDVLFCEGCINGPAIRENKNYFSRKKEVVDFVADTQCHSDDLSEYDFASIDLSINFHNRDQRLPEPSDHEIEKIFHSINKKPGQDELNCGACGYPTCREYAKAVYKGLAESEMCLPYLIEKMDVTHRELQNSLKELHDTQEQLIQSEKLASVGQLAAGVAHEVNNPLGSIILYAHLLLRNLPQNDPKVNDVALIVEEASRCKNIVGGLLDFARQGKLHLEKEDILNVARKSVEKFQTKYKRQFSLDVKSSVKPFFFDPDQLTQVIDNLLKNAIDATEENGTIALSILPDLAKKNIQISISDNGCGIDDNHKNKLFTPFFTTKKAGEGTGLGLPIVYGIIKMHKGQITINSKKGIGTEVKISLPYDPENNGKTE